MSSGLRSRNWGGRYTLIRTTVLFQHEALIFYPINAERRPLFSRLKIYLTVLPKYFRPTFALCQMCGRLEFNIPLSFWQPFI